MSLIQELEEISVTEINAKKYIAEFLLKEKEHINKYSMQQIADQTFTSKSTLFRFAQNLNYSGWKEFMQTFLKEIDYINKHYSNIDPNLPFLAGESSQSIVEKLTEIQIESIRNTADLIDYEMLNLAVDRILNASRNIVLFGISPNNLMGQLLRRKLNSIGIILTIANTDENGMLASGLNKGDCAILVSYSGNNKSREPMRFLELLKKNHVNLIAITSAENNYLRENVDCCLTISSREKLYSKIGNFTTEESILHIFNLIYACLFSRNFIHNYNYKVKNSENFEYRRNASLFDIQEKRD
ncbi:MAG TPA: MurR/RpiR family transcriptional regulator [Candidatus Companilactobacillus pullicola]|uniref:MurR/RpiR family transcriptional regulator n=2 Tax=Companilactobacillus TaxID=2767879 RepID=A0A9D1ZNA8_9LACO|nr:MurR/RpiR family transcriptional regulator [Candidatus Companilactobacillus pullicola]